MGKKTNSTNIFKLRTSEISPKKTWTCLRKGNLKRETESLPIAAPNNAIMTNYVKGRIDKRNKIADIDCLVKQMKISFM